MHNWPNSEVAVPYAAELAGSAFGYAWMRASQRERNSGALRDRYIGVPGAVDGDRRSTARREQHDLHAHCSRSVDRHDVRRNRLETARRAADISSSHNSRQRDV